MIYTSTWVVTHCFLLVRSLQSIWYDMSLFVLNADEKSKRWLTATCKGTEQGFNPWTWRDHNIWCSSSFKWYFFVHKITFSSILSYTYFTYIYYIVYIYSQTKFWIYLDMSLHILEHTGFTVMILTISGLQYGHELHSAF